MAVLFADATFRETCHGLYPWVALFFHDALSQVRGLGVAPDGVAEDGRPVHFRMAVHERAQLGGDLERELLRFGHRWVFMVFHG